MTGQELFQVIERWYADKPDDFVISVGHVDRPYPSEPICILNQPEVHATISMTMRQVREWAQQEDLAKIRETTNA